MAYSRFAGYRGIGLISEGLLADGEPYMCVGLYGDSELELLEVRVR